MTKEIWIPQEVENYLQNQKQNGNKLILPDDVYCTENFTWNEVLQAKNRNLSMPSQEILNNLYETAKVVQVFRTETGIPITIESSWRTPAEQQELIDLYKDWEKRKKEGKLRPNEPERNKPSETSLHLEGLAFDVSVNYPNLKDFQKFVDESFIGEVELGSNYTHIGLTTFSAEYLKRHGLYKDNIYKKLNVDDITMQYAKNDNLNKRLNPKNWKPLPLHFKAEKNKEVFGIDKNIREAVQNIMKTPVDTYIEEQKEPKMRTFEVSTKKEKEKKNLFKKLKELINRLKEALENKNTAKQGEISPDNKFTPYVESEKDDNSQVTAHQEPEDDGLVIIPNIKNKNTDDKEPQFPYETKVEAKIYKPENPEIETNTSENNQREPEINPELLKPIELPEETQNTDDGMPTGGAAGIEEPKIPDDIKRESQKYSDPLFMESYLSEVGEYGTLREKFKNGGSFHYNRYEKLEENLPPAERELSRLKRNVEKINEMLEEMKEQLDYHEKVVNVYNCPELAEFYLYKPVTNIIGSILEDYCIMEGIDIVDI